MIQSDDKKVMVGLSPEFTGPKASMGKPLPLVPGESEAPVGKPDRVSENQEDAPLSNRVEPEPAKGRVDDKALESLERDILRMHSVKLKFAIHEGSGRRMIRVFDRETGVLIREIPPEAILDIKAKLSEIKGNMLNISI